MMVRRPLITAGYLLMLSSCGVRREDYLLGIGSDKIVTTTADGTVARSKESLIENLNLEVIRETNSCKAVLLHFYSSYCGVCQAEIPALNNLHKALSSIDGCVVLVGEEGDEQKLRILANDHQLRFPYIIDYRGGIRKAYKVSGVPQTVLLDSEDRVKSFKNPISNEFTEKILGPANWDDLAMIESIKSALQR